MHRIDFDEEKHEYYVNGILKPSVSQIISSVLDNGSPIPEYAWAAIEKGTYVHKAIKMWFMGKLDEDSIDESAKGYFNSFKKWYKKSGLKMELVEQILYNPAGDYCMTLDYASGDSCLIDWKTGQIYAKYSAQLGGYADGYEIYSGKTVKKLSCVQLLKNGIIAKEHIYDLGECVLDWRSINRIYRKFKSKGGL